MRFGRKRQDARGCFYPEYNLEILNCRNTFNLNLNGWKWVCLEKRKTKQTAIFIFNWWNLCSVSAAIHWIFPSKSITSVQNAKTIFPLFVRLMAGWDDSTTEDESENSLMALLLLLWFWVQFSIQQSMEKNCKFSVFREMWNGSTLRRVPGDEEINFRESRM